MLCRDIFILIVCYLWALINLILTIWRSGLVIVKILLIFYPGECKSLYLEDVFTLLKILNNSIMFDSDMTL